MTFRVSCPVSALTEDETCASEQFCLCAGRDVHRGVSEGGTWLGITREGRFGVLTNFRCHHSELRPDTKSRGEITGVNKVAAT